MCNIKNTVYTEKEWLKNCKIYETYDNTHNVSKRGSERVK